MDSLDHLHRQQGLVNLDPTDSCGVGFVASVQNIPSREILQLGLTSLANVAHRGAVGADGKTGDGAGVTTTIPRKLLARWLHELKIAVPANRVGVGVLFFPGDPSVRNRCEQIVQENLRAIGLRFLGFRDVPIDNDSLGEDSLQVCPRIVQVFVDCSHDDWDRFERELFLVRRGIELAPKDRELQSFYVASMSCRTISYKGMVLSTLLDQVYPDLRDVDYQCEVCLFHQRFSTNTSPEWSLCQPFRMLAHNGEINTIRGNRNWMTARESSFHHPYWDRHRAHVKRLFSFSDSDSASLDNTIELLTLSGRSLLQSISMLIPPAWKNDVRIPENQKAYFEFHGCFCEPWDGPSSVAMTDGKLVVAGQDRNGLRPARYKLTRDGILIVGSEAGAERIDDARVVLKGRLGPGELLAVDLVEHRLMFNEKIKTDLAESQPYQDWMNENRIQFAPQPGSSLRISGSELLRQQIAAGVTREEVDQGIAKMAENGIEPTFSMGLDTPLAVLSRQPRSLSDYFKQRFAQVTNPPIDPIREALSMSLDAGIGPERNILTESPDHCRGVALENPILLPGELKQLQDAAPFDFETIDCTWDREEGSDGLKRALRRIVGQSQLAVDQHVVGLVLSDRSVTKHRVAVPMLMAVGAIHHELGKSAQRLMCSLIAETSSVRDSHQLALLFGYGGTVVDPYLAYDSLGRLREEKRLNGEVRELHASFREALSKGMLKIMSKMGISVLNSYQGAQIFEAIGVGPEIIEMCFKYSFSSIGGVGFEEIANDCLIRHDAAFQINDDVLKLDDPGISKPKRLGEHHLISGRVTKSVHRFARGNDASDFQKFSDEVTPRVPVAIRDLLNFVPSPTGAVPIEDVEPIEAIRKRFTTAAMSLGAISPEAHEAIAIAMNMIGGKSNSGEGGEDPVRFLPRDDGSSANSKIKQVASGRFGVNAEYLANADEIEIKMAQGAKPGEGGQLPGFKVNQLIAKLRNTEPGVTLISPPPHHDIYSIEDLAQLIHDLKMVNPLARICVKLVAKTGVGGIAVGVAKAHADSILISGHEGGTGASPLTSIKHAGSPWELGLAETHQSLIASSLRDRVVLRADGGLKTGRDIIHAAILGAEEYNFGTMALIALGCVYVKKCHLNNCPVGIATQDPKYREKFKGTPENLVNYLNGVATECREIMAELGVRTIDELIGRTELLRQVNDPDNPKTHALDLSTMLFRPSNGWTHHSTSQKLLHPPQLVRGFDDQIVDRFVSEKTTEFEFVVCNTDRNIGTRLSGILASRFGSRGNTGTPIRLRLTGTAGQSLGAFLCHGVKIELAGEANDYVGKGMSGGEIVIRPPVGAQYDSRKNVIAGNTILYGATGGKLFVSGLVAERFCVRNSGAIAVVEGCGDHGCEYMTRGTVVILGPVGNNFAAGMTGGVAFVYDPESRLPLLLNRQSAAIQEIRADEIDLVRSLITEFQKKTGSVWAKKRLSDWEKTVAAFQKIAPIGSPSPLAAALDLAKP